MVGQTAGLIFVDATIATHLMQVPQEPVYGPARGDLPNVLVSLVDSDQRSSIFPNEVDRQQKEES